jgi:hypothetical protein
MTKSASGGASFDDQTHLAVVGRLPRRASALAASTLAPGQADPVLRPRRWPRRGGRCGRGGYSTAPIRARSWRNSRTPSSMHWLRQRSEFVASAHAADESVRQLRKSTWGEIAIYCARCIIANTKSAPLTDIKNHCISLIRHIGTVRGNLKSAAQPTLTAAKDGPSRLVAPNNTRTSECENNPAMMKTTDVRAIKSDRTLGNVQRPGGN